jgi:fumarate hydratase class II
VIAPASTGSESNRRRAVIPTDHTNKGIRSRDIFAARMLIIVVMKLIAPKIEDAPAKWREKIVRSTLAPECEMFLDRGG